MRATCSRALALPDPHHLWRASVQRLAKATRPSWQWQAESEVVACQQSSIPLSNLFAPLRLEARRP